MSFFIQDRVSMRSIYINLDQSFLCSQHMLYTPQQHFTLPPQSLLPKLIRPSSSSHSIAILLSELPLSSLLLSRLLTLLSDFHLLGECRAFRSAVSFRFAMGLGLGLLRLPGLLLQHGLPVRMQTRTCRSFLAVFPSCLFCFSGSLLLL